MWEEDKKRQNRRRIKKVSRGKRCGNNNFKGNYGSHGGINDNSDSDIDGGGGVEGDNNSEGDYDDK